ncbi:MAG: GTP-binding protein HflX, GTP-binding protein HflX [Candidatus Gottesmanbacteria bacterium GW2011_GWA2_43_14]|uniref:GTPase HflX n=1 Tax=Candidatus Gottesmanbacteria bacterium GW2011_GWA2_43_14 TaxID=1618443 RepID=A0A0G1DL82_9BACT|nr:MAG: GTP-binding protein HflX, GTP-binding protein HflX [Candidatus Gottesmanbacteria bacterium GW2011_GWA2_43_14]
MLVGLFPKKYGNDVILSYLEELDSLVRTYGGETTAVSVQKGDHSHRATYIGSGKANEVADKIAENQIDTVVFNDILKSGQLYTLEKIFQRSNPEIKVLDKIGLILLIFDNQADTAEAKLQIKLASLRHMGPRTYGMGYILSRQGGGIGTRGIGETNTEIMQRHWRNEIRAIKTKLTKIIKDRQLQIAKRKKAGTVSVSLVGYTNAGKTSLYNALTGKNKLVENRLFATLDSSIGRLYLPEFKNNLMVSDTIGFIQNLPPQLLESFKSTLLESIHADLILHVIDVSDRLFREKIEVVEEILAELDLQEKNQIYIFNKADKITAEIKNQAALQFAGVPFCFVSAKTGLGLQELKGKITGEIKKL